MLGQNNSCFIKTLIIIIHSGWALIGKLIIDCFRANPLLVFGLSVALGFLGTLLLFWIAQRCLKYRGYQLTRVSYDLEDPDLKSKSEIINNKAKKETNIRLDQLKTELGKNSRIPDDPIKLDENNIKSDPDNEKRDQEDTANLDTIDNEGDN